MLRANLGEGGEETTRRGWRDFGSINRSNHEPVANGDTSNKATDHEKGIVGGKAHEDSSSEEDDLGYNNGVAAAYPVGGSAGGNWANEAIEVKDSD